ncbi:MAG: efflux RND transporter permease subunit [Gemmatimonadota bacterium]|nr:efflux RND transporter permease subunit [Gemmatimonadota bacterium]
MKKIIQFSVDYPVTVLMLVLAVLLLGYISFQRLGMDLFPDLENPRIFIELKAGERPPEEIEKQFVRSLEAQAIQQRNAVQVSSVSRAGSARITVQFAWGTSMDEAFLVLQKAVADIRQNTEIEELTISQHDPNAAPIVLLGLSHPQISDMDELRKVAESYIRNELIRLEGIAEVRLLGQEEKEVVVETSPYLLEAFGLTPSAVAGSIRQYNRNLSGGSLEEMGTKYIIKGISQFGSLEDIGQVIVAYKEPESRPGEAGTASSAEGIPVFLKDVAEIHFQNKKPDNIVRMNQQRCMGLAVYKETKYNTVKAVDEFMEALGTIEKALPGYELTVVQNKGEFISRAIDEVEQAALVGILLAVIVLFVFLRRIGATLIISLAIPISIVATFNLMYFNGLSLNIMTLGGLALGAGMLVDNAIIVMENIFRNLEQGCSLKEAAVLGTSQVGGAITASTVTTIVVFLPIVYLHGAAGELFKDQAWTVAFSLLSSLVVAILVIPMLSMRLLKEAPRLKQAPAGAALPGPPTASIRFPRYSKFLGRALDARWAVILLAALLVAGAAGLLPLVGSEFIPATGLNDFVIELELPEGTELGRTESTVAGIEKSVAAVLGGDIKTIYSVIGPSEETASVSGAMFEDENTATIKVVLDQDSPLPAAEVFAGVSALLASIPGLESRIYQEQTVRELTLGTQTAPMVIEIQGEDLERIQELAEEAEKRALECEELFNVETSFDRGRPEVDIVIDRIRAGVNKVSLEQVSTQLKNILMGAEAGQWDTGGELKDITVKLPRISVSQLEDITIPSGEREINLDEIADIQTSLAPKEIYRRNQVRIGKVTAHIKSGTPLDQVAGKITRAMSDVSFPPDYRYNITGEEQKRREAFENLKFALILSLILVYMVLASQFESLLHPFTIILSIPLAAVGAVAIFFFLGQPLNIMAYIGIIMLVGIAVNDSIILVDAINQLKREGLPRQEAIIQAGQRRIRPIIITSLTTILALLPLTVGIGEGAALRAPMALAVIGGLVTSTLLTLVVIPCVYAVIDRFGERVLSK